MGHHKHKKVKIWKDGKKQQKQSAIIIIGVFFVQIILNMFKYRGWTTITIPNESFPSNESLATTVNIGFLVFIIPLYMISQFNFKIAPKKYKNRVVTIICFFGLLFLYTCYDFVKKKVFN